jgi:hypothetical protein
MIPPEAALLCAVLCSCLAFAIYRGPVALVWSFVVGYLVLPVGAAFKVGSLPPIDKDMAVWVGAAIGTLLFQPNALRGLSRHPADVLAAAAIVFTAYTSIDNDLGLWDGLSSAGTLVLWTTLPYVLGRIHLRQRSDLVLFGKAVLWGALAYIPLAVWEFRMSPQLHTTLYGYFPHAFGQQMRWGHFRPVVFLGHGLSVAAYFASCLLIGIVLHKRGFLRTQFGEYAVPVLLGIALGLALSMSVAPWMATLAGWGLFVLAKRRPWLPVLAGVPGLIWVLVVFGTSSNWHWMTEPFRVIGADERADSLQYRLDAMTEYADNIKKQPWWGYGAWGRGRITGRATDSEALICMLTYGLIGAATRYAWLFWLLIATIQASERAPHPVERELLLLFACLMAIGITGGILGTASVFLPVPLIGGAVTGFVAATRPVRRRDRLRGMPVRTGRGVVPLPPASMGHSPHLSSPRRPTRPANPNR